MTYHIYFFIYLFTCSSYVHLENQWSITIVKRGICT